MNTTPASIEITGATRAADAVGSCSAPSLRSVAPTACTKHTPPAEEQVWVALERMLAAREAARAFHPAGSDFRRSA